MFGCFVFKYHRINRASVSHMTLKKKKVNRVIDNRMLFKKTNYKQYMYTVHRLCIDTNIKKREQFLSIKSITTTKP
jgi:hypothetical protein